MPPHHSSVNCCTHPVPHVMGYSALFDLNTDEVFTCLNLPSMDYWDVVPYTTVDYPSRNNVSVSSFLSPFVVLSYPVYR